MRTRRQPELTRAVDADWEASACRTERLQSDQAATAMNAEICAHHSRGTRSTVLRRLFVRHSGLFCTARWPPKAVSCSSSAPALRTILHVSPASPDRGNSPEGDRP